MKPVVNREITEIKTEKEFEKLKKGDVILVVWSKYTLKHHDDKSKFMSYEIYENKKHSKEIICQLENNHYFNYEMYLKGLSVAEKVYKTKKEDILFFFT